MFIMLTSFMNAQTFDFSCGLTTEELIFERKEMLSSVGESSNYVNNVSGPNAGNSDIYEVIISRTLADGTEKEYFHKGIDNSYLGNADGNVEYGFDVFYAEALQAAVNAENDAVADTTTARTLLLKGASSATTSVTIRWDGGHVITVDGNDILARDHGHNNYGRSTQDQFDALLKVVEDAVIAADFVEAAPGEAVGKEARYLELEALSRDGVNITAADAWDGWRIKFKDDDDNLLYFGEQDQDFIFNNPIADLSPSEYLYEYNKYVQRVIDLVNAYSGPADYTAFTIAEIDLAVDNATTDGITVTWESNILDGNEFVKVIFTDKSGTFTTPLDNEFLNGEKLLVDATSDEFDAWVLQWNTILIPEFQRKIYETQLETAFENESTSTISISLYINGGGNDAILFSSVRGDTSIDYKFNDLLENKDQNSITTAIANLSTYVGFAQAEFDTTPVGKIISKIDNLIATTTAGTDVLVVYDRPDLYQGTGDVLIFLDVNGDMTDGNIKVYATIPFGGKVFEDLEDYEVEAYLASFESEVTRVQAAIEADN